MAPSFINSLASRPLPSVVELAAVLFLAYLVVRSLRTRSQLPPGPSTIPVLGNADFPKSFREPFRRWAREFGDVMTYRAMGVPVLIVNTRTAAAELLEKRTSSTGFRPPQVMADELVGLGMDHSRTNDVVLHRQYRRLFAMVLGPRGTQAQWPVQVRETRRAALEILESPDKYEVHLRRAIGAIAFRVAYGRKIETSEDPMLKRGIHGIEIIEEITPPGAWLVDIFPFLKYVPEWFPGARFKRLAKEWREHVLETRDSAWDAVKAQVTAGTAGPSLAATLIQDAADTKSEKWDEAVGRWLTWSLFTGGSDTSTAAIQSFIAAMLLYPHVQQKAQEELDRVVGRERPPTLEDRDRLPYCMALVAEVLRWQPVVPFGLPHCMHKDEIYNGYLLPKGTIVVANIWAMTRDPTDFPDSPDDYIPERFLDQDGKLKSDVPGRNIALTFGFGRRVCPGWHLAHDNILAAVIAMLWSTTIKKTAKTEVLWRPHNGVQQPLHMKFEAEPRFPGAVEILRASISE